MLDAGTGTPFVLAGTRLALLPEGALWWAQERALIVADLHLEKGSSLATRGRGLLPPYDTAATLARLGALIARLAPALVIALGDSFHDGAAHGRVSRDDRETLAGLQRGRDWLWIAGNHDPAPPEGLGGMAAAEAAVGPLTLRHEPRAGAAAGEVAGHLHPCARVRVKGRSIRRRCFASDGARMILPAFGAYAGGLNVRDKAFTGLFAARFHAWMLGGGAVHPVARAKLLAD